VISTYLRVEIHLIVKENRHLFNAAQVDTQYVIWGDLDTIWLRNFDSCTLAKPTLLSVSGCARSLPPRLALYGQREAPVSGARAGARSAGTWDPNAGIGYYNVTAMSMIFDDMVAYAVTKDFKFSALDNTLMVRAWAVVPPDSWPRPQYASAAAELTPRARRRSLRGAASRRCPTFSTGGPTVRPRPAHLECQRCTSSGHPPLTPAGPGAQGQPARDAVDAGRGRADLHPARARPQAGQGHLRAGLRRDGEPAAGRRLAARAEEAHSQHVHHHAPPGGCHAGHHGDCVPQRQGPPVPLCGRAVPEAVRLVGRAERQGESAGPQFWTLVLRPPWRCGQACRTGFLAFKLSDFLTGAGRRIHTWWMWGSVYPEVCPDCVPSGCARCAAVAVRAKCLRVQGADCMLLLRLLLSSPALASCTWPNPHLRASCTGESTLVASKSELCVGPVAWV